MTENSRSSLPGATRQAMIMNYSSQKGGVVGRILLYLSFPVVIGIIAYLYMSHLFLAPMEAGSSTTVLIEVPKNASLKETAKSLEEKRILRKWWTLTYMARLTGGDKKILAGEYEVSPSLNALDLLKKLTSGKTFQRKVTVREGVSIWQIGALLEEAGIVTKADFDAALTDQKLLALANIPASTFEGYLFPETYSFSRPIEAKDVIWKMMLEGEQRWAAEYTDKADQLQMDRHKVLTLASIIEKESGNKNEQPLIASVFHNRMRLGMRLQSDPTVIYGITNFDGNLTRQHLDTPTPYNTYTNAGLPPGPICNPGETAIKAALYPDESPYLYFVGDGHGSHVFSSSLDEHNENVKKYQLNRGN